MVIINHFLPKCRYRWNQLITACLLWEWSSMRYSWAILISSNHLEPLRQTVSCCPGEAKVLEALEASGLPELPTVTTRKKKARNKNQIFSRGPVTYPFYWELNGILWYNVTATLRFWWKQTISLKEVATCRWNKEPAKSLGMILDGPTKCWRCKSLAF